MIRFILFILMCCILYGCSTQKVVERKLEVTLPAIKDTVAADTIISDFILDDVLYTDTIFEGVLMSKGSKDTAAVARFIPRTGNFIFDIPERKETVIVKDTIRISGFDAIPESDDPTEKIIWIISFILTSLFIIIYKRKLKK
jgi:hypothetical protein